MPAIAGTFPEDSDSVLKETSHYLIFNRSVINDHGWWLVDTDFKVLFLDTYRLLPNPEEIFQASIASDKAAAATCVKQCLFLTVNIILDNKYPSAISLLKWSCHFFATVFSSSLHLSSLEDDVHTFGGCRANMVESNRTCSIPILFKLERALSLKSLYLKKNSKNTSLNLQTERNQIFNLTIRWSWSE